MYRSQSVRTNTAKTIVATPIQPICHQSHSGIPAAVRLSPHQNHGTEKTTNTVAVSTHSRVRIRLDITVSCRQRHLNIIKRAQKI